MGAAQQGAGAVAGCHGSGLYTVFLHMDGVFTQSTCWSLLPQALLLRVFSTAAELWQEEVGARLHQRNWQRVQACWDAWQLYVLQAQERRRQAILWNAAEAFR